jgi:SAM-dependent methyltransferase
MRPKDLLKQWLPNSIQYKILDVRDSIRYRVNSQRYRGTRYYCPVCENGISEYLINDNHIAFCPICDSSERHRVDWLFFSGHTNLFDGISKKLLHVAPELFFADKFSEIDGVGYVSIDLEDPRAMLKMDLTDIQFPDNQFDVIYCSHVLEHIEEDRKAIGELVRVTTPGGWGLLQVPVTTEITYENPAIVSPEERNRVYGHPGHVRLCGKDYIDRIREVGWETEVVLAKDFISEEEFDRYGILNKERYIFFCRKPM